MRWERAGDRTRVELSAPRVRQCACRGPRRGHVSDGGARPRRNRPHRAARRAATPREVYRYLPHAVDEATRDWLQRALTAGEVTDARLKLAGDLAQFPFADGKGGPVHRDGKGARRHARLCAEAGRRSKAIDGELRFEGAAHDDRCRSRRACSARSSARRARPSPIVARGRAAAHHRRQRRAGPLPDFLRFVRESPVDAMTGHFTRGCRRSRQRAARARPRAAARQAGQEPHRRRVHVRERAARIPRHAAAHAAQRQGRVHRGDDVRARDVTAEMAGGPAKFAVDERRRVASG